MKQEYFPPTHKVLCFVRLGVIVLIVKCSCRIFFKKKTNLWNIHVQNMHLGTLQYMRYINSMIS